MKKVEGSFWKANLVSIWMNSFGTTLFTTRTVDELLWGYEDPLLTRVSSFGADVEKVFGLMYKASTTLQVMKAPQLDVVLGRSINLFYSLMKSSQSENHCSCVFMTRSLTGFESMAHFNDLNLWIHLEKWK